MTLAFTVVLSFPSQTFLWAWLVFLVAAVGLWLLDPPAPRSLGERVLEAAWWACVPAAVLGVPLMLAIGSYVDAWMALCQEVEPRMVLSLDVAVLGTIYATSLLTILGWRTRGAPEVVEEPALTP